MRYFTVTCKRGHCGKKQYFPITFAIAAETLFDACNIAKSMPGVKHSQPVLRCEEITFEDYTEFCSVSAYDRITGVEPAPCP